MVLTRSTFLEIKSPKNGSGLHKLKLENYFSKKATLESIKIRKRLKKAFLNYEFGIIIRDVGDHSL